MTYGYTLGGLEIYMVKQRGTDMSQSLDVSCQLLSESVHDAENAVAYIFDCADAVNFVIFF